MDNKAVFERLFNKNFSDTGNRQMLEAITTEHPYFSGAQFYLLQQTAPDTEEFSKQAAKATVLFNNPHWLNFQLQQTNRELVAQEKAKPPEDKNTKDIPVSSLIQPASDQETETSPQVQIPTAQILSGNDDDDGPNYTDSDTAMKFELRLPADPLAGENLSFEPMHLVDYFASQGIKLSDQEPTDKLGKQLKSFTEWLKTMKKLPGQGLETNQPVAPAENPVEHTDLTVQALAEKSNQEQDVVTEAMAEVLASQGKRSKAVELYQKLSLMNPSKIAYFAAKIEQLKDT